MLYGSLSSLHGAFSSLGVGRGAKRSSPKKKKQLVTKCHRAPWNWTVSSERPRQRKMDVRFRTWDIRSRCRADPLKIEVSELAKYNLDVMAVQEVK
jgi:hypothetical protein